MADILIQDCARKQFGDALQVLSIPGMYPFTLEQTKVNHWGGSPEGLVDYPITFRSTEETSRIHDCRLSR